MLKGIDPLLHADVLYALRAMGHGDTLVVADTNFPYHSCAAATVIGEPLRMDADAPRALRAVCSVMPLDTFIEDAARRMMIVDAPDEMPPVQEEALKAIRAAEGTDISFVGTERFEFYERAKGAFAVLQTGERRFYGCFILSKGVVAPDGA